MMDERAVEAARRASDTVTGKDPGMGHFVVSIIKSIVRIIGYVFLMSSGIDALVFAGITLIIAEGLGMLEEIV